MNKYRNIIIAIILATGFVLGVRMMADKIAQTRLKNYINVTGNAEKKLISDIIVWEVRYEISTKDMQEGYKKLSHSRDAVKRYLASKGVSQEDITIQSVDFNKLFRSQYENGNYVQIFDGYNLSQRIRIMSKNVDLIEEVARNITELIDQGHLIYSETPRYYYSKLNESKHELLKVASEDALGRAKAIAQGSGRKVGKLKSSQMGVFQIIGLYSAESYNWGGAFNTADKEKNISITVKNCYSLK